MSMGGGHSTTTTTQELSPEQRALIAPVIPIAQQYLAKPPKMYPGSGISGFTPQQLKAQQMTMQAASRMLPTLNQIPGQISGLNSGYTGVGAGFGRVGQGYQGLGKQYQGVAGQYNPLMGQYEGLRGQENFLTSGDVLKASSNPYLQGAIEAASRPTIQQFQQQIMPSLQEDAIGAGSYGGTRQGIAGGLAGQAAVQKLGDIASSMSNENYQAGLNAMTQGFNASNDTLGGIGSALQGKQNALAGVGNTLGGQESALTGQQTALGAKQNLLQSEPGLLSSMTLPAQLTGAVGQQQQMMNQAKLSEQVQKYVNQQMIPFSVAQDVAQMAFGMPGGTTTTNSTQPGNPMMGIQAGLGAVSMLPMLMGSSDRRLKNDIEKIATLYDGLGLYRFKYRGGDLAVLGLMADEVEEVYPNAVQTIMGYKHVDYQKVPSWMEVSNVW